MLLFLLPLLLFPLRFYISFPLCLYSLTVFSFTSSVTVTYLSIFFNVCSDFFILVILTLSFSVCLLITLYFLPLFSSTPYIPFAVFSSLQFIQNYLTLVYFFSYISYFHFNHLLFIYLAVLLPSHTFCHNSITFSI